MEFDVISDYLKKNLSEKRYVHTVGVANTAKLLAEKYGGNPEKAFVAGLLHDCAKEKSIEILREIIERNNDTIDTISENSNALLHGVSGAWLSKELFSIDDEIFDAIKYHTTGKPSMSLLTKIVFIADYIEPGRKFDGVEEVRNLAYSNIDDAIIKSCSNVIIHTVNKGGVVHPNTVDARNYLLLYNRGADDEKIFR